MEIIGVAVSGKSTLTASIRLRDPGCRVSEFLHARVPHHLPYIARGVPRLLPILVRDLRTHEHLDWADVKLLVYVTEWHRYLKRRPAYRGRTILFDQGPLYALTRLKAKRRSITGTSVFQRWWGEMVDAWADRLDTIVFLDAADPVLWERINGRRQPHAMKGLGQAPVRTFILTYREIFEEIVALMEERGGPQILRLDTSDASSDDLAERCLAAIAGSGRVAATGTTRRRP